jgi:20S proteasome alpha/beta subunit
LWKANAIGRNSKNLREYLEKNYKEGMTHKEAIKLAVETLMEVVESSKNIEICLITLDNIVNVDDEEIDTFVKIIEKEREEENQKKKQPEQK